MVVPTTGCTTRVQCLELLGVLFLKLDNTRCLVGGPIVPQGPVTVIGAVLVVGGGLLGVLPTAMEKVALLGPSDTDNGLLCW